MRSQTYSLVLVVLLALSNYSYAQFDTKEYLTTIGDLVNKKGFSENAPLSPLQALYYVQLLQPGFLWKDLTTMILLNSGTEFEKASGLVNEVSKNFVEKIKWPYAETPEGPVSENGNGFAAITPVSDSYVSTMPKGFTPEITSVEKKENVNESVVVKATSSGTTLLPAELTRIKRSDYIEYGSLGFYYNTAIIHPSYKAEITSLAQHMKADPAIHLVIHGYCNGDAPRTIITAGIMTEFFEINQHDQKKSATAKELSELRAAYAKRFLIAQGIRPERVQIIGEGAERMIYPATSKHAHYNDRIELEIIRATK